MRMIALLVTVAGLPLAADAPSRSELDRFQGTWVLVSQEFEGKAIPVDELSDLSFTVRGDKVYFSSRGEDRSATIKLDPSKTPKTYDLLRDDGLLSLKGLYTWDRDNLKFCSADDQGDRPTEFKTGPGSKARIRVWNRKK